MGLVAKAADPMDDVARGRFKPELMTKAPDPMEEVATGTLGVAGTALGCKLEPKHKAADPMEGVAIGSADPSCMDVRAGHKTAAGVTGLGTAILCATGLEACA